MDGRLKKEILFQQEKVARALSRLKAIEWKLSGATSLGEDTRLILARKSLNKQLWAAEDQLARLLLQKEEEKTAKGEAGVR